VTPSREPIFNIPAVVMAIIALFVLVYAGETLLLTNEEDTEFLYEFGFVPARYDAAQFPAGSFPGGIGADVWSFVTYGFIHGSIFHLAMNVIWFLPFACAVARRFGALRFMGFFAATTVAGALAHLITHRGDLVPMIGASAGVSGFMAAAIRFAFQRNGPIAMFRSDEEGAYRVPAAPLAVALRDRRIVVFLLAWFGLNLLFGIGSLSLFGIDQSVAWQAHIGGFIAGLLLFSPFDPVRPQPRSDCPGP
jgi:membrane associated rhomboid family serine protease